MGHKTYVSSLVSHCKSRLSWWGKDWWDWRPRPQRAARSSQVGWDVRVMALGEAKGCWVTGWPPLQSGQTSCSRVWESFGILRAKRVAIGHGKGLAFWTPLHGQQPWTQNIVNYWQGGGNNGCQWQEMALGWHCGDFVCPIWAGYCHLCFPHKDNLNGPVLTSCPLQSLKPKFCVLKWKVYCKPIIKAQNEHNIRGGLGNGPPKVNIRSSNVLPRSPNAITLTSHPSSLGRAARWGLRCLSHQSMPHQDKWDFSGLTKDTGKVLYPPRKFLQLHRLENQKLIALAKLLSLIWQWWCFYGNIDAYMVTLMLIRQH